MEIKNNVFELLNFEEQEHHGLHGHVRVSVKNNDTGEVKLWDESDNIIPISGYQWILMKMFGLYLDSTHNSQSIITENLEKDTNISIPDLNELINIGISPSKYSTMFENIASNHFVQGFMVGDGAAVEDANTTKNTDYSYVNLRNPIPFQETQDKQLNAIIANKYLGDVRKVVNGIDISNVKGHAYYIKKFDNKPQIIHSWYKDGQKWDYVDPVTRSDLGPISTNIPKTNRIETYVQCGLSIDASDCIAYFNANSTRTPRINEIGLVSYNTINGQRSTAEVVHSDMIEPLLKLIYETTHDENASNDIKIYANSIIEALSNLPSTGDEVTNIESFNNSRINEFLSILKSIVNTTEDIDYDRIKEELSSVNSIEVTGYYNQNGVFQYTTDKYMDILSSDEFTNMTTDEAERIKLITCYTFPSIPLAENTTILFDYRIYAN